MKTVTILCEVSFDETKITSQNLLDVMTASLERFATGKNDKSKNVMKITINDCDVVEGTFQQVRA